MNFTLHTAMETNMENELEEIAFLDVTVYADRTAKIEILGGGKLSDCISDAMIKDDTILELILESYIKYQYKINTDNINDNKNKSN